MTPAFTHRLPLVHLSIILCHVVVIGVSIPVDGGGLLTSWFNTDLQPRLADNGEDVVFGPDHTSNGTADVAKD